MAYIPSTDVIENIKWKNGTTFGYNLGDISNNEIYNVVNVDDNTKFYFQFLNGLKLLIYNNNIILTDDNYLQSESYIEYQLSLLELASIINNSEKLNRSNFNNWVLNNFNILPIYFVLDGSENIEIEYRPKYTDYSQLYNDISYIDNNFIAKQFDISENKVIDISSDYINVDHSSNDVTDISIGDIFTITYELYIQNGNSTTSKNIVRTIEIVEHSIPEIFLIDSSNIKLFIHDSYLDPVSAYDKYDGDITSLISISNEPIKQINGNYIFHNTGIFTIYYNVTDSDGYSAEEKSRTFQVISRPTMCRPYSSFKNNQLSKKMLKSKMVLSRKKIVYHNSNVQHILHIISGKNEYLNKELLLKIGKKEYDKYFNSLTTLSCKQNSICSQKSRNELLIMYQTLFINLTYDEECLLNYYENNCIVNNYTSVTTNNLELLNNVYFTFYCRSTTIGDFQTGPRKLVLLNMKMGYTLIPGKIYKFDLSDTSNYGYQLSFSKKKYDYNDIPNIYFYGTPGTNDACMIYIPNITYGKSCYTKRNNDIDDLKRVYIYNKLDTSRDSFDIFGNIYESLIIQQYLPTATSSNIPKTIVSLPNTTMIRKVNINGPKYYLIEPNIGYSDVSFNNLYDSQRQYALSDGTYVIMNQNWTNPFTIINNNNENISLFGNENKKQTFYLNGLDEPSDILSSLTLDGSYNFYYGNIFINVSGDFGTCSLYSYKYGYNQMESLFVYDNTIINGYDNIITETDISYVINEVAQDIIDIQKNNIMDVSLGKIYDTLENIINNFD